MEVQKAIDLFGTEAIEFVKRNYFGKRFGGFGNGKNQVSYLTKEGVFYAATYRNIEIVAAGSGSIYQRPGQKGKHMKRNLLKQVNELLENYTVDDDSLLDLLKWNTELIEEYIDRFAEKAEPEYIDYIFETYSETVETAVSFGIMIGEKENK